VRYLQFFLIFLLIPNLLFSQIWEIGAMGGVTNYQGDINPRFNFKFIQPAGGALIRKNFNPAWSLKGSFLIGNLKATDSKAEGWQNNRNISFKTDIKEIAINIELNFLPYITGVKGKTFSPYIFTGVSVFQFNPKTEVNGQTYSLQSYGTEGQGSVYYPARTKYFLVNFAVPFGGGFKVSLGKYWCLGFELGMRKTFTDYLDDVSTTYPEKELIEQQKDGKTIMILSDRSLNKNNTTGVGNHQRGNSKNKDWYMFSGITLTYVFRTDKCKRAFTTEFKWE